MDCETQDECALRRCFIINAYYMGWVVCPVSAVRASHSAVDLRTHTDADQSLCSLCIKDLVGGLMRIFVLKRLSALTDSCAVAGLEKLLPTKA